MSKSIYELSKLKEISMACDQATIAMARINTANASISAISELVIPSLKRMISGGDTPNYFELNASELRDVIDKQGNTIYNTTCVLTEMNDLSALIDSKTATLNRVIDDINTTINGVNNGINAILNSSNSQGVVDHE